MTKKTILLKITGEIVSWHHTIDTNKLVGQLASQMRSLEKRYRFALVIGGGNILRGSEHKTDGLIDMQAGHHIGMLATMMNGLLLQDICKRYGIQAHLLSAIECPALALSINAQTIAQVFAQNACPIFVGGTGNPYFTTDTNAVLRALEIKADQVWKGTKVDGIYDQDPVVHPHARAIASITYADFLHRKLQVVDPVAVLLAQQYVMPIRVFNIFQPDALIKAAEDSCFGSIIT